MNNKRKMKKKKSYCFHSFLPRRLTFTLEMEERIRRKELSADLGKKFVRRTPTISK
jgi:hypothetical protein